jgi:purine-binding chemotaxis protein CheW
MICRASPREILRARAEALARPAVVARRPAGELHFVVFTLDCQQFALPLAIGCGVEPQLQTTPVPCTPPWIRGLINVRGEILAVIDLAAFFGIERKASTDTDRVIVIEAGEMKVGVLADEVLGTRALVPKALAPPLPGSGGLRAEYVQGITADGITVLDAKQLFADQRLLVQDETEP